VKNTESEEVPRKMLTNRKVKVDGRRSLMVLMMVLLMLMMLMLRS
jgi:hypothetical protein